MTTKEFYEGLVKAGHSDHFISFVTSVDGKEILIGDFIEMFKKVPRDRKPNKLANGTVLKSDRSESYAIQTYDWLIKCGRITKPNLL